MTTRHAPVRSVITFLATVVVLATPFYVISGMAVARGEALPEWILGIMFAPAFAALIAWPISGGRPHPGRFRLLPIVLGLVIPALIAIGYFVFVPFGLIGIGQSVSIAGLPSQLPVAFVLALGEEFGWRGYLLPHLRRRFGFGKSNGIVAAAWWLYHAPLIFFGVYGTLSGTAAFTANIIMFSFVVGVLWEYGGGVVSSSLAHGAWNVIVQGAVTTAFVGSPLLLGEFGWITTAVLVIVLAGALATMRRWPPRHPPRVALNMVQSPARRARAAGEPA